MDLRAFSIFQGLRANMGKTFKDCGFKKDWRNKNKKKFKKEPKKKRFTDDESSSKPRGWENSEEED